MNEILSEVLTVKYLVISCILGTILNVCANLLTNWIVRQSDSPTWRAKLSTAVLSIFYFTFFGFWLMSYVLRNYFDMSPKDVGHLLMHPWMATLSLGFILSPLLVEKTSLWPWKLLGWCGSLVGALFAYSTVVSLLKS